MAFTDELTIHIKAGKGGDGVLRWLHEKGKDLAGPAGGNGGRGADVYALARRDTHLLARYKAEKEFRGQNGGDGGSKSKHGANGDDYNIEFPVGSIITNLRTGEKINLLKDGERVLLLKGGDGGRGNESYKSSVNRSPTKTTKGKVGEEADFYIEVELIADIGLIGLPNAGKTSLLNELTRSQGKVGAYPFTTLEPALGDMYGYIIADIPGLIEGAAEGKGLGHKFLRHIRRTKVLAHLLSLENEDIVAAYKTIRAELERYDKTLMDKKEIIILTKTDLIEDPKKLKSLITKIKKLNKDILTVTVYDDASIKNLTDELMKELKDE